MVASVTISTKNGWFKVNKKNELILTSHKYEASYFQIRRVDQQYAIENKYMRYSPVGIILYTPSGCISDTMVATIDTSNDRNWKIIFKPCYPYPVDDNIVPSNAAIFGLNKESSYLSDARSGHIHFRCPQGDRMLSYTGFIFKQLRFPKNRCRMLEPTVVTVHKGDDGFFCITKPNEFFG